MIAAITGANGFIGGHLARRFAEAGWHVRPVIRGDFERGTANAALRGADVVVHAAGATRAPRASELRASNVDLTRRVLESAVAGGSRRFVFISSQAAAGPAAELSLPVDERAAAAPVEAYGRSKRDAEAIVRASRGIETTIVRPAAVFGPGDRDFLGLFRASRHGVAIHAANRDHWISIIHARDVAEAVLRCADAPAAAGRTYFLANDEPVQWAELFRLGAECAGRTLRLDVNLPAGLVHVGAWMGDAAGIVTGRAGLLSTEKVALSKEKFWVCSNAAAKRDLSFAPRIELRQGFAETYAWYRENEWL